jgi:hypothetical protein
MFSVLFSIFEKLRFAQFFSYAKEKTCPPGTVGAVIFRTLVSSRSISATAGDDYDPAYSPYICCPRPSGKKRNILWSTVVGTNQFCSYCACQAQAQLYQERFTIAASL